MNSGHSYRCPLCGGILPVTESHAVCDFLWDLEIYSLGGLALVVVTIGLMVGVFFSASSYVTWQQICAWLS